MWPRWAEPLRGTLTFLAPLTRLLRRGQTAGPSLSATRHPTPAAASVASAAATLAERMPDLLLQAQRASASLAAGQHQQHRAGWGETFWQYRPAQPGEPASHIDWRQSARSTHAQVREQEAESARTILLWCDFSASMQWRSDTAHAYKLDSAILLLLTMAGLLLRAGERVRLLGPDGPVALPPTGPALERLAIGLTRLATTASATPHPALPPTGHLPRHAHILIASDFLCPDDALNTCLRQIASSPARAHLIHIMDPAEIDLPYQGRVLFTGLEGEPAVELSETQDIRQDYARLVSAYQERLSQSAVRHGHDSVQHRTDSAPLPSLLALHALMGRHA